MTTQKLLRLMAAAPNMGLSIRPRGMNTPAARGMPMLLLEKSPEQIQADVPQHRPAEADGRRHIGKTALHQHHIAASRATSAPAPMAMRCRPG